MANGGNRFVKGIITDLPAVDISNQHWVFPTVNIRITKQANVFVAKPVNGNEELFSIPDGYDIVGAKEYQNILYIVLYKEDKTIQLGTYPYIDNEGVYNYSYRALKCLNVGGIASDFITSAFNFDGSTIDIEFAESYDGTIDIYLNGSGSPTIKINSNMSKSGEGENLIDSSTLPYSAYLLSDASIPMTIDNIILYQGGKLEPGKYIIFLRYSTKDYNKTSFLTESSPFDVHSTINSTNNAGQFLLEGSETKYVNTKIEINVSNLDESFMYYQIAVLVASGNNDEEITYKTYLVSEYIPTSQTKVIIDGYEDRETLSLDEITAISFVDNINKCQTVVDNRYIGGNWESEGYDKTGLLALSSLVTTDNVIELDGTVSKNPTYFPGEIYPFGVIFRFSDGRESETFPISGYDYIDNQLLNDGLIRMPLNLAGAELKNFGLKFNLSALKSALNSRDDIIGYIIVRGERIKNILANGIAKAMIDNCSFEDLRGNTDPILNGLGDEYGDNVNEYFYSRTSDGAYAVPDFFEGYYPLYKTPVQRDETRLGFSYDSLDPGDLRQRKATQLTKRVAFFSPDIALSNEFYNMDMEPVYISLSGNNSSLTKVPVEDSGIHNYAWYTFETSDALLYSHYEYNNESIKALTEFSGIINGTFVKKGTKRVSGLFSAFIADPFIDSDSVFTRKRYCTDDLGWGLYPRSSLFGSYIGLSSDVDISNLIDKPIVITRYENLTSYIQSASSNFQIRNTTYSKVSQFIKKDTLSTINIFNGDSYLGKIYLRGEKWFGAIGLNELNIGTERYVYNHGALISFNCFSGVNFYMRGEVDSTDPSGSHGKYSFWPRVSLKNSIEGWNILSSNEEDMHESNSINPGYNKSLSPKTYIGYDDISPLSSSKHPTRIRNSSIRTKGAYYDGFKTFYANDVADISENAGDIIGIYNLQNILISIQPRAISKIYTNVRQSSGEGSFDIVTGSTASYLYDIPYRLSTYGALHKDHVIHTGRNIYGIDIDNKIIWVLSPTSTPEGKPMNIVEDLGKEKLITKYIFDLLSFFNDNNIDYSIKLGYDKYNFEVLFTFKWSDDLNNDYEGSYLLNGYRYITLVFNEALGSFIGLYSLPADMYTQYKTNLISISHNAYIHYRDSARLNFFGQSYSMVLSWIVNNAGDDAPPLVKKFFEAVKISCPEIPLKNIKFKTEIQSSEIDPFIDESKFWQTPKYNEFQYEISIPVNSKNNSIFGVDSSLKGFWLKITVEYEGEEDFYMIHSDTLFNPINY
ncbi:MAG: hypothetical protein JXR64_02940 [Spirochaetales bacterium]|nr:hypothetical protein [Spirochaetales bacterium]